MADEITALEGDGVGNYQLLFIYPIITPQQINGQNVVPTPSANLPQLASLILSQSQKASLDQGTSAFEVITLYAGNNLTNPQLVARGQSIYASRAAHYATRYAAIYKYAGAQIDAS